MFDDVLGIKTPHSKKFQVLFLRNDSHAVEIHEVGQVDYMTIQERLERGESVFITSRNSQKIKPTKQKAANPKTRLVTAFYLE